MNTTRRQEYLKIAWIARKMCQFLKNTKTRIETEKNTRHDTGKTQTRHGYMNCQVYFQRFCPLTKTFSPEWLNPQVSLLLSPPKTKNVAYV